MKFKRTLNLKLVFLMILLFTKGSLSTKMKEQPTIVRVFLTTFFLTNHTKNTFLLFYIFLNNFFFFYISFNLLK